MFSGKIVINIGFNCNFKCAHCANSAQKNKKLSPDEIGLLISTINKYGVKRIHFIGGEPFLYLKDIKRICAGISSKRDLDVSITTNGSFAKSYAGAIKTLRAVPNIKRIQLSYDKFHSKFMPFSRVKNLVSAAKNMDLGFSMLCAIQEPADMLTLAPVRELGNFPIIIQKVLPQGRAVESGSAYSFYEEFDPKVLKRRCPDRKDIVYFCGKGFSACCSALMLDPKMKGIRFPTAEELFKSRFYGLLRRHTLGEMAELFSVSEDGFKPEHSSVCNLCAYIFSTGWRRFFNEA